MLIKATERTIRAHLGANFIPPQKITQTLGLLYPQTIISRLSDQLPTREQLNVYQENDMVLVAGPPQPLSFTEMRFDHRWSSVVTELWDNSMVGSFLGPYGEVRPEWYCVPWSKTVKTPLTKYPPAVILWIIIMRKLVRKQTSMPTLV